MLQLNLILFSKTCESKQPKYTKQKVQYVTFASLN